MTSSKSCHRALVAVALCTALAAVGQTMPKPAHAPAPAYPPSAERAGHEGTVLVQLTVQADGSASDVAVAQSSGSRELDDAAVAAVAAWTFSPATTAEGKAIASRVSVPFRFALAQGEAR